MSNWPYTDEELNRYFNDPVERRRGRGTNGRGRHPGEEEPSRGFRGYLHRRFRDPLKVQAAYALSVIVGLIFLGIIGVSLYLVFLSDEMPSFEQLDDPTFQLATVAYTADGRELARYAWQNRSWATFDEISPHVINGLIATEDRRFYNHWGIDTQGILSAAADALTEFDLRGASTISQQLARNLYNEQIGRKVTPGRKLKEMVTAVQLERRYTKREIIEMYLNTVEFGNNAFGVEAAAHTFGKSAAELDELEGATLVGMLKAVTYYNPVRNPENARRRRNVVLSQMARYGYIDQAFYAQYRDSSVVTDFNPSEITESFAPYFAEYVRNWLNDWGKKNGRDFYAEGLKVYTTIDSRIQQAAQEAVSRQMEGLQAVVDYEWGKSSGYGLGTELESYIDKKDEVEPFAHFWNSQQKLVDAFVRETPHFKQLRESGVGASQALAQLKKDEAFVDSLKAEKTRLEAGLLAVDPRNGQVKAWVGGRDLKVDWYDHVATARRQPGSTFKPFVYTAAIDNGYSPNLMLPDSAYAWRDPSSGQVWRPGNFGGSSGGMRSLSEAIATSNNLITARVITQLVNPQEVVRYAHRMGIKSELDPVPALGLGTSDVTLLELASAYSTLANGGLYFEPTVVTRIEDQFGNVLYEATPAPQEALNQETAYTIVDMMRGVLRHPAGTGQRIIWQFGLGDYDLAAKTGTTQNSADGWFMLMHPELVTGAWVGFNDRRIAFRSNFWGQGAHNALYLVGDFFKTAVNMEGVEISKEEAFPLPSEFSLHRQETPAQLPSHEPREPRANPERERGRVGW